MPNNLLSIIVPILNESDLLLKFLDGLSCQEFCELEVIFCDGGSWDDSVQLVKRAQSSYGFPVKLISSQPGRGKQMNAGAKAASGSWYLFMHIDSMFEEPRALMLALSMLQREKLLPGQKPAAGHFQLRFQRKEQKPSFSYFFYESKSRLDLPDCIHGDQGLMLNRSFFEELGGFEEHLPFLEDSALVDRVNESGRWVLLPSVLTTSARRFEMEGLRARQTLNALIMNFRYIGWQRFFDELPGIYRQQTEALPLDLLPFWLKIRELLSAMSFKRQWQLWLATGGYVRSQAWQLLYAWHCYAQFRHGQMAILSSDEILERMTGFERITSNPIGRFISALLVWCWFHLTYLYLLKRYFKYSRSKAT